MPKLDTDRFDGPIPKGATLKRRVEILLSGKDPADAVIALTDVYTGTSDFINAQDAKNKMQAWVGNNSQFYPHAAQYDFEAWLLPYWSEIKKRAGSNHTQPSGSPENVNHNKPPSKRLQEVYRTGSKKRSYVKEREAAGILRGKNLMIAIVACNELKAFINTILSLCNSAPIP
jgi:hypothetical protein